jgi:hypothetical protein
MEQPACEQALGLMAQIEELVHRVSPDELEVIAWRASQLANELIDAATQTRRLPSTV